MTKTTAQQRIAAMRAEEHGLNFRKRIWLLYITEAEVQRISALTAIRSTLPAIKTILSGKISCLNMKQTNFALSLFLFYAFVFSVNCKKTETQPVPPNSPTVSTKQVAGVGSSSVISGGEIVSGDNIADKGIVWGLDSNLSITPSGNKTSHGPGKNSFTDTLQNLQPNTTYYLRAYALSGSAIGYGATLSFKTLPPQPTVYIVGYHGLSAVYWKNGKLITLPGGTYAHSVCVVGSDVYIAGENNSSGLRAMYWKNGTATYLTDGRNAAVANSICVVGNDVYVAGYELFNNDPNLPVAKYWKNGVPVALTAGTGYNSGVAYSISAVGNDVYVAGYARSLLLGTSVATYWKNGTAVRLNDSTKSVATALSIFVKGSDVYVAGQERAGLGFSGVYVAKYWRNGVGVSLTDGRQNACAYSIYATDTDVHVGGSETSASSGYSIAKYWKNGTAFSLTDGAQYDSALSVYVVGSDVYVSGWESDGISYGKAKYWKNGTAVPLEISAQYSTGVSVFVQ